MSVPHYLWPGVAALGLATGIVMGKAGKTPPAEAPPAPEVVASKTSDAAASTTPVPIAPPPPLPVSTDTVESLLAADESDQYARLGLWLIDASAQDMEAFWNAYVKLGPTNEWIKDLVFSQWAKKDVTRLFEIAKRDKEEGPAWWAWAMSDPDAALAASENAPMEMRDYALRGFANFHPERAMKMLQEHPELAEVFDLGELAEEVGKDDPRKALEFLSKYKNYTLGKVLGELAEDDPREAFEWLMDRDNDPDLRKDFLEALMRSHPEAVAEFAAELPAGASKRDFEITVLMKLAETDPQKALEEAGKVESPVLAAERMAKIGSLIAASDPEKALQILGEILAKCPDASYQMKWSRTPDGGGSGSDAIPAFDPFLQSLSKWNPELTIETLIAAERPQAEVSGAVRIRESGAQEVASQWLNQDPTAFIQWANSVEDSRTFDSNAELIYRQFAGKNDFETAFSWAERISDPDKRNIALTQTIISWSGSDSETAARWMQKTELPEETRNFLKQNYLERSE